MDIVKATSHPPCPAWRNDLSDGLAWLIHEPQIQTYADNSKVLWALYTPEQYLEKFQEEPVGPIPEPEELSGNSLNIAIIQQRNKRKEEEKESVRRLTYAALATWPQRLIEGIMENGTLINKSLQMMFEGIKEQCPLTADDYGFLETRLAAPFLGPVGAIRSFTARKLIDLNVLAANGQAIPNLKAVAIIISCFQANSEDIDDYSTCWTDFYAKHGALENQQPFQLCEHINSFVAHSLPHQRKANGAKRASASLAVQVANAATVANDTMELEITKRVNAALAAAKKTNGNSSTPLARRTDPKYCWSCGPLKGHYSKGCWQKTRKPGHQDAATDANRMGGKS